MSINDYTKDFSPSNCIIFKSAEEYYSWWASQNYATYTEVYQFDGKDHFVYHTFPISVWCEMKNIKPKVMYDRLNNLRRNGRCVNDIFVEDRQHYLSHPITSEYRMKLAKTRLVIIPGYEFFERKDMYRFSFHD